MVGGDQCPEDGRPRGTGWDRCAGLHGAFGLVLRSWTGGGRVEPQRTYGVLSSFGGTYGTRSPFVPESRRTVLPDEAFVCGLARRVQRNLTVQRWCLHRRAATRSFASGESCGGWLGDRNSLSGVCGPEEHLQRPGRICQNSGSSSLASRIGRADLQRGWLGEIARTGSAPRSLRIAPPMGGSPSTGSGICTVGRSRAYGPVRRQDGRGRAYGGSTAR